MAHFDKYRRDKALEKQAAVVTGVFKDSTKQSVAPLESALSGIHKDILKSIAAIKAQIDSVEYPDSTDAIEKACGEIIKAISALPAPIDHSNDFEALEALIRGEIQNIPKPEKPEKVNLQPVIKAVGEVTEKVTQAVSGIQMPEIPKPIEPEPRKTHWTFNVIRNKNTGLIERIEAE